jgi:uncharacterized protein (UPF0303 family)
VSWLTERLCGPEELVAIEDDIARLKTQEERLRFQTFTEEEAWTLGAMMRSRAQERGLPLVIDIRAAGRKLFYSALPGSGPDNEEWVRRKINVVMRFQRSSYRMGRELALKGESLNEARGIAAIDYAPHGGSFPIHISHVGIVGTVTVSGIPQREDHNFVVECLCKMLNVPLGEVALAPEAQS